jgi:hypothetical protein
MYTDTTTSFVYQPPASAHNAQHILVKPNLGYPLGAPVTVSIGVLGKVLQSLRQSSPNAKISIVEGVCSPVNLHDIASKHGVYALLDAGMELLDADTLPLIEYPNLSPAPVRFKTMWAPELLQQVDCRYLQTHHSQRQAPNFRLPQKSLRPLPAIEIPRPQPQFTRPTPRPLRPQNPRGCLLLHRTSLRRRSRRCRSPLDQPRLETRSRQNDRVW